MSDALHSLLTATRLLDLDHPDIEALVARRGWRTLGTYGRIGAVYDFVRNEIAFGYNEGDELPASRVLADDIGQCNTKSTLLMPCCAQWACLAASTASPSKVGPGTKAVAVVSIAGKPATVRNSCCAGLCAASRKLKGGDGQAMLRRRPDSLDRCLGSIEVFGCFRRCRARNRRVVPGRLRPTETAQRQNSSTELLAPGIELGLQSVQNGLNGYRNARLVVRHGRGLCTRMERGLDAPESDGVSSCTKLSAARR